MEPNNNEYFKDGEKYYKRWTVLDVKASTIEKIKKTSKNDRTHVGKTLDNIVEEYKK